MRPELVCRVLKEVHPDVGISKQGMQVMNTFATDMFDRIMKEAAKLTQINKRATLSSRDIQTAGKSSCLSRYPPGALHACLKVSDVKLASTVFVY